MPLPAPIANAPELSPGLELYYRTWLELGSDRSIGMSEGRIPSWAVRDRAISLGLSEEQTEDLQHHVRQLDNVYLKHLADQREKGSKNGGRSK